MSFIHLLFCFTKSRSKDGLNTRVKQTMGYIQDSMDSFTTPAETSPVSVTPEVSLVFPLRCGLPKQGVAINEN